jgi:hypothetical protein
MADITFYDSLEEMFDDLGRAMKKADARVKPTQAAIKPGQYFINYQYDLGFPIFGEIMDIETLGANPEEQKYINEDYAQPHMRYYKPTKAYSVACPEGEYGDIHVSEIDAIIDKELFGFYRKNNWMKPRSE